MRIIFFGTADFALPSLDSLSASIHEVVAVVTQPDRPAGRGRHPKVAPVARSAISHKLRLLQPEELKDATLRESLARLNADILVAVAYGKFLPESLLEITPYRGINLHPSLLPKYRGPSPINWALLSGDKVTGVTTLYITAKMDAGDILQQEIVPIEPADTAISLHDRLASRGADLLVSTIDKLADGAIVPRPQNEAEATFSHLLRKEDGLIDWALPTNVIINRIRALQPWPSTFTRWRGDILKIFRAKVAESTLSQPGVIPGTIVGVKHGLQVATGDGEVILEEVQLAGKKRLSSIQLLNGYKMQIGEQLT